MMPRCEPITFINRHTGQPETERVYGEAFLRWTYETSAGRAALHALAKRAVFSRAYGWLMDTERSRGMIAPFIAKYGLDPATFRVAQEDFASFNEFFCRELQPGARPVDGAAESVVFPADGRHFGVADVSTMPGLFVKGQHFDLARLLGSAALAERYARGVLVLSRLCPVDYHRFHFPCAGTPGPARVIEGPLFSVSPVALRQRLAYMWENKRAITALDAGPLGVVQIIEVGATNVGSIVQTFTPGQPVEKGAQKGMFRFGGSSTITLFEPGRVSLAPDLLAATAQGLELYAWMGEAMAARLG